MPIGYSSGLPFGDPNSFTRSTGEDEIDRFNQWLRSQDYWQQARAQGSGDMNDAQRQMIMAGLGGQGVDVPDNFVVDSGGNFNQTNRLDDNLKWGAIIGGTALGGLGLAGIGPLGGALGLGGAGSTAALPASIEGLAGSGFAGSAGGLGATAVGAGSAAAGAGGALAPLASTQFGSGMVPGLVAGGTPSIGAGGTAAALASGMVPAGAGSLSGGTGSVLGKIVGDSDMIGDIADVASSYANDERKNRIDRGNFAQQYDNIALRGRSDDRSAESDALKKLSQTSYISSGGAKPLPTHVNSGPLTDLGFGPRPSSDSQKMGASTLEGTLLKRLTPEGQFKPTPLDTYAKPGLGENIGRYTNYGAGAIGALDEAGKLGTIGKGLKNAGKWIGGLFS